MTSTQLHQINQVRHPMPYQPADLAEYNLRQTIKHLTAQNIPRATLAGVLAKLATEFQEVENV